MRKNVMMAALLAGLALAAVAQTAAPPALVPPGGQAVPAGGVVIPQVALQACAAEGGCILISRQALQEREQGAMLAGMLQACTREQSKGLRL